MTSQQLYGHLLPISEISKLNEQNEGHYWRSKDELISNILLWTLSHGQAGVRWPARTYLQQLCTDTGCSLEDLQEAMDRDEKWERESGKSVLATLHDDDDDDNLLFSTLSFQIFSWFVSSLLSVVFSHFILSKGHFSMPNFIPISWLYIRIVISKSRVLFHFW